QLVHQWDVAWTQLLRSTIALEQLQLQKYSHGIQSAVQQRISMEKNFLEQQKVWIIDNNPIRIMDRGYAMVFQDRKRILDLAELDTRQAVGLVMGKQTITINEG